MRNVEEEERSILDTMGDLAEPISEPQIIHYNDESGNERYASSFGRTIDICPQPTLRDEMKRNPTAALENRINRRKRLIKDMFASKNPAARKLIQDNIKRLEEEAEYIRNYIDSNLKNSKKAASKKSRR